MIKAIAEVLVAELEALYPNAVHYEPPPWSNVELITVGHDSNRVAIFLWPDQVGVAGSALQDRNSVCTYEGANRLRSARRPGAHACFRGGGSVHGLGNVHVAALLSTLPINISVRDATTQ
jgi:hypothetical protein